MGHQEREKHCLEGYLLMNVGDHLSRYLHRNLIKYMLELGRKELENFFKKQEKYQMDALFLLMRSMH
jgi:hypothetical protein